ncbi:MAG: hypothetical protein ACHQCH_03445 [Solirubrobacterales bacterium]
MNDTNPKTKSMNRAETDSERLVTIEHTIADGHEQRLAYPGDADWLLLGTYPQGGTFAVAYDWPSKGKENSVLIVSLWVLDMRLVSYDPDTDVLTVPDDLPDDSTAEQPGVIPIPDASTAIPRELLERLVAPGWSDQDPD